MVKTAAMQLIEHRIGRPLYEFFTERYTHQGLNQREIADELGVDIGSVSRWMARLRIPSRRAGKVVG